MLHDVDVEDITGSMGNRYLRKDSCCLNCSTLDVIKAVDLIRRAGPSFGIHSERPPW